MSAGSVPAHAESQPGQGVLLRLGVPAGADELLRAHSTGAEQLVTVLWT